MKEPKYEPLKMVNKKHADNYGIKMRKYLKKKNDENTKTSREKRENDRLRD